MSKNIINKLLICLLAISSTAYAQDTLKILSFGDLFLGSWAVEAVDTNGVDYPFRGTLPVIQSANLVIANLECPFTDISEIFVEKQFALRVPPRMCQTLAAAGIRAVNLANNHILDYGFPGLDETTSTLSQKGILYFGAGHTIIEAFHPAKITLKNTRIAIFGFSTVFPSEFWADSTRGGTAFPYEEIVRDAMHDVQKSSDVIIVHIHWGAEMREMPKDYQVELGHLLVDFGADMVFGHHAHVPLGIEIYKGAPIFYGLGNFAFGSYSDQAKGMAAEVGVAGDKVVAGRIIPLNVNNVEVEFSPALLKGAAKAQFIQHISSLSDSLNSRSVIDPNGNLILSH